MLCYSASFVLQLNIFFSRSGAQNTNLDPCSGFSLADDDSLVHRIPGFSFSHQTEPIQGQNSGVIWHNGTGEGPQYHQDLAQSQNGFDSFSSFQMAPNGTQGSDANNRSQWNTSSARLESEQMLRLASQESTGAHANRAVHAFSYDQSRSSRSYPPVSQAQFISLSTSDVTDGSSPVESGSYVPEQQFELQAFDNFHFPGSGDIIGRQAVNGVANTNIVMTPETPYGIFVTANDNLVSLPDGSNNILSHASAAHDSVLFNSSATVDTHSPTAWDTTLHLESQQSSPPFLDDWVPASTQITSSATNSPLDYSPSLNGISPRYVQDYSDSVDLAPYTTGDRTMRKPIGPRQSKVVSDLASRQQRPQGTSETSDESYRMVGRSSLDVDNTARDHPLYQNVTLKADGLYHCPWEGQDACQHKPEKLKCNYDKFVDSHLKPYRCKVHACENSRFSSTACLLRHEREAHAMHGHGDKPYLCTYEGCERGVTGNGFPRHWNLRDHMKRVHNDTGTSPKGNTPPPANASTRSKKRKLEPLQPSDPGLAEKKVKRTTTPPVSALVEEPTMVDQFVQSKQRLDQIVQQLDDPRNPSNLDLLRSASDCIKAMARATQRINVHESSKYKQLSGPG